MSRNFSFSPTEHGRRQLYASVGGSRSKMNIPCDDCEDAFRIAGNIRELIGQLDVAKDLSVEELRRIQQCASSIEKWAKRAREARR